MTTTLVFKTINELWEFKRKASPLNVIVATATKSLTAEFSEADIKLAKNDFNALQLEEPKFGHAQLRILKDKN